MKNAKAEQATACASGSQQQPATVLGSRHNANLFAGGSCDFTPQTHDSQVIPGLPPLPELPFPPTHSTSVQYSSAVVGREGGLHSTTVEEVAGKSASISQPCERPPACRKTPTPTMVATQAKSKNDSTLFNPAGLSTSDRVSEYLATAGIKAGGGSWVLGARTSECQPMPLPSSCGISGLYTARGASYSQGMGTPSAAITHPAMRSAVHRATCGNSSEMTKTRSVKPITVSPGPPVVVVSGCWTRCCFTLMPLHTLFFFLILQTGNSSVDKSIQSVRDQMTKVRFPSEAVFSNMTNLCLPIVQLDCVETGQ